MSSATISANSTFVASNSTFVASNSTLVASNTSSSFLSTNQNGGIITDTPYTTYTTDGVFDGKTKAITMTCGGLPYNVVCGGTPSSGSSLTTTLAKLQLVVVFLAMFHVLLAVM